MEIKFLVLTPKDQGIHNKFEILSRINSHAATSKHARLKAGQKATLAVPGVNVAVKIPSDKQHKILLPALAPDFLVPNRHNESDEAVTYTNTSQICASIGFDQQLLSPLDSFLRLPVQISPREYSLLQFWLRAGRCYAFNTSSEPEYCPALYTAQRMLSRSKVCVFAHIVAAEAMHLRLRGESHSSSSSFYLRRAQAYRAMYNRLNNPQATFHDKLADLMQMASMELMLGQVDLLAQHIHALRIYIQNAGGMAFIMSQGPNLGMPLLDWQCYLSIELLLHLQIEVRIPTLHALETMLDHFLSSLKEIRVWIRMATTDYPRTSLRPLTDSPSFPKQQLATGHPSLKLDVLKGYFRWLIKSVFNLEAQAVPYRQQAAAFCIMYRLCWTQAKYKYSAAQSVQLLERFEHAIEQSTQASAEVVEGRNPLVAHDASEWGDSCRYRPNILASSNALSGLHHDIMPTWEPEADIQFWDTTAEAIRLLPLMNSQSRLMLAEQFMRCAFLVPDTINSLQRTVSLSDYMGYFRDSEVEQLGQEIRSNWIVRQSQQKSSS